MIMIKITITMIIMTITMTMMTSIAMIEKITMK